MTKRINVPTHKSLSNTFGMHQKLNKSYKDGLSVTQGQPKRPQGKVQTPLRARCLEIYDLEL